MPSSTPALDLTAGKSLKVFGVEYVHTRTPDGADLWVTEYGLPLAAYLDPAQWYQGNYYIDHGTKLPGSTGTVYRVRPRNAPPSVQFVVKFSRIGQEVPLVIDPDFPDDIREIDLAHARFNSPWEEFGLVMELRRGGYGAPGITFHTQRPLAIFAPPERFELWQLGRTDSRFMPHQKSLSEDQAKYPEAVELDIRRDYIVIYGWVGGIDAVMARTMGLIDEPQLRELTQKVVTDLRDKGFRVLDNKPDHFILRIDPHTGELARRHGELVYALVDFELLQRTPNGQQVFRDRQREHYFKVLADTARPNQQVSGAYPVRIMGVDYIFGRAPNGGMVWAVGNNPDLLGYFQPDRWRRTPRVQLSLSGEVCRTRTRDNIHVVYRRSKVGLRPNTDPFYGHGKRTREYGYNSPFEEVAAAEKLRSLGIPTVYPRAIYRTGHFTSRARHLRDMSRIVSHAHLVTPDEPHEPILSEHHDYYTLWGQWRGIDPLWLAHASGQSGRLGFIDAEHAMTSGLLTADEVRRAIAGSRKQLVLAGCDETLLDDHQFLFIFDSQGRLQKDPNGNYDVALAFDALTSLDLGLIDEKIYTRLVQDMADRLNDAGYEALNLTGSHLLLSFDTHGRLRTSELGELEAALCNFDLIAPIDPKNAFINQD